jgi:hypothetical protein
MIVYTEVDISEALDDVSTTDFYRGSSDETLWEAVQDIATMMTDPTLRGLLGMGGGARRGSHYGDDAILDSMLEESHQFNDFRMGERIASFLEAQQYRGIGVGR